MPGGKKEPLICPAPSSSSSSSSIPPVQEPWGWQNLGVGLCSKALCLSRPGEGTLHHSAEFGLNPGAVGHVRSPRADRDKQLRGGCELPVVPGGRASPSQSGLAGPEGILAMNKNFCPSEMMARLVVLLLLGHNTAKRGAWAASSLERHRSHRQLRAGFGPAAVTNSWLLARVCWRKATENWRSPWSWAGGMALAREGECRSSAGGFWDARDVTRSVLPGEGLVLAPSKSTAKLLLHSPGTGCRRGGRTA